MMADRGGNLKFLPFVIRIIHHIKSNDYETTKEQ